MIDLPAFDLCFDCVLTFTGNARGLRPLPCVIKAAPDVGFRELHRSLGLAMRDCGLAVESWSVTPHITMFYDPVVIEERHVEAIRLRAREFVIIHSHIGSGRRYELLGSWSLRRQAAASIAPSV
jgi:RNA 2',3'-cyclic 3'-phosphodiesterase